MKAAASGSKLIQAAPFFLTISTINSAGVLNNR